MRYLLSTLLFLFFPLFLFSYGEQKNIHNPAQTQNRDVSIKFSLSSQTLKGGEKAFLQVQFLPGKHIHVNTVPPPQIRLDSNSIITLLDSVEIPNIKDTTIFNVKKKLRQEFQVATNAKEGKYAIKGKCIYTYCSEGQDECFRFSAPFEIPVNIIK